MYALNLRAGPQAIRLLQERGLRSADVDSVIGASGGPKWLAIAGLDRYLFGEFFNVPRARPLHVIGSSIGSWRMACLAQRDALAALNRGHDAYIHAQDYNARPTPAEVSVVSNAVLRSLLGDVGVLEILAHPSVRLHIITSQTRGLANRQRSAALGVALATSALMNLVTRRSLSVHFRRVIFDAVGASSPFRGLHDLPTTYVPLTSENLRPALLASGAIPMIIEGVAIPSAPGGLHFDGGITDYHPDFAFGSGNGIVLYPHFYSTIAPGWFDKSLPWRRATGANFQSALILSPTAEFAATFPGGRIPDRRDFATMSNAQRTSAWEQVRAASAALGDELGDLVSSGRIADRLEQLW
jgi:hypothetical protein